MIKYRWLIASLNRNTFADILSGMLKKEFSPKSNSGFRLEYARKDNLKARYIVKNIIQDKYEDPFGNIVVNDIITYDVFDFKLNLNSPNLILKNPPRNIKPFLFALSEASNFKVTIQPLMLNLNNWIDSIETLFGKVMVIKLQGSGLSLSDKTSAQVLISGTEDVRGHWGSIFPATMPSMDKAKIRLSYDGHITDCELTKQGSAILTNTQNNQDKILSLLTESIAICARLKIKN
jgi:hypothetical protein